MRVRPDKALMKKLKKLCDIEGDTELINQALTFLEWGAAQRANGLAVGSIDERNKIYHEVSTPALDAAAKHSP